MGDKLRTNVEMPALAMCAARLSYGRITSHSRLGPHLNCKTRHRGNVWAKPVPAEHLALMGRLYILKYSLHIGFHVVKQAYVRQYSYCNFLVLKSSERLLSQVAISPCQLSTLSVTLSNWVTTWLSPKRPTAVEPSISTRALSLPSIH